MSILFKNAQIIDPTADDVTTRDLMVRDGKIVDPSGKAETVIECSGKYLAPGIVDIGVKVCEPGERHKESYKTAGSAAAAGGVTTIVTRPDTDPAIDTPEALEFIPGRGRGSRRPDGSYESGMPDRKRDSDPVLFQHAT